MKHEIYNRKRGFTLSFTLEEIKTFLEKKGYHVQIVHGWVATHGNKSSDDSFEEAERMLSCKLEDKEFFLEKIKEGNLDVLSFRYNLDWHFQMEMEKALLLL